MYKETNGVIDSKKVYLAIPYSKINKDFSFLMSNAVAAAITISGICVFAPISHSHIMAKDHKLPGTWDFWEKFDEEFIKWSDEVWIVSIPGSDTSVGVQAEIAIAVKQGKEVKTIEPLDWITPSTMISIITKTGGPHVNIKN